MKLEPIRKEIVLEDGGRVVLVQSDAPDPDEDGRQRNIYRFDQDGQVIWQIGKYSSTPRLSRFTDIYIDDAGRLKGYNFDSAEYQIDLKTGRCGPRALRKHHRVVVAVATGALMAGLTGTIVLEWPNPAVVLALPGLLGSAGLSGNMHAFSLGYAMVLNGVIYAAVGWWVLWPWWARSRRRRHR